MENLHKNPVLSVATIGSFIGLLLDLIGTSLLSSPTVSGITLNLSQAYAIFWYYFVFYTITSLIVLGSLYFGRVEEFRMLSCLMLAITLSFLPSDIAVGVALAQQNQLTNGGVSSSAQSLFTQLSAGGATRAAGLILSIFCNFITMSILATPNLEFEVQFKPIVKKPASTSKVAIHAPAPKPSPVPAKPAPEEDAPAPVKDTEIQVEKA